MGVKGVMSIYTPFASRKRQKRCKKGVFHEMTSYHIKLCYSLLLPKSYIGIVGKLVRNNQSWRPRVDLELRIYMYRGHPCAQNVIL